MLLWETPARLSFKTSGRMIPSWTFHSARKELAIPLMDNHSAQAPALLLALVPAPSSRESTTYVAFRELSSPVEHYSISM